MSKAKKRSARPNAIVNYDETSMKHSKKVKQFDGSELINNENGNNLISIEDSFKCSSWQILTMLKIIGN